MTGGPTLHVTEMRCPNCSERFFVNDGDQRNVEFCPFCKEEALHPVLDVVTR